MKPCSTYVDMNNPLLTVPGVSPAYKDIVEQMGRCQQKNCDGSKCCTKMSITHLSSNDDNSGTLMNCMADDNIDDDCKICCWLINGLI